MELQQLWPQEKCLREWQPMPKTPAFRRQEDLEFKGSLDIVSLRSAWAWDYKKDCLNQSSHPHQPKSKNKQASKHQKDLPQNKIFQFIFKKSA